MHLVLYTKYNIADTNSFYVAVSTNGTDFVKVWSNKSESTDWDFIKIDLKNYIGQLVFIRIGFQKCTSWVRLGGGVWIDKIRTVVERNEEYKAQPMHYTILSNLPEGEHQLASRIMDHNGTRHPLSPIIHLIVSNQDTDRDRLPDAWEAYYGFDPTLDDSSDDPDKDGFTNWEEYICGTDPLDKHDFLQSRFNLQSHNIIISTVPGRVYTLEYAPTVNHPKWTPLASSIVGNGKDMEVFDINTIMNHSGFFRIRVDLQQP